MTRFPSHAFLLPTIPLLALGALAFAAPPATTAPPNGAPAPSPIPAPARFASDLQPLTAKYCVSCHTAKSPPGGVDLTKYKTEADLLADSATWQKVQSQLTARAMPPAGLPAPTDKERSLALEAIDAILNPAPTGPPDPGRVLIHRLNRAEYNNTIRDLTGVDTHPADHFPADGGGGGGFDNDADTLFLPPVLMERYLQTASDILAMAKPERIAPVRPSAKTPLKAAARADIAAFATRAYRRPLEPAEVDRLLALTISAAHQGATFDQAVNLALKAVLISPDFLFRSEQDPAGATGPHPLSDYALASRLSYFLWSSMPDDTLLDLAARHKLSDPAVLAAQTRRMLRDPRARALSENFVGQWLRTRDLYSTANPDPGRFPDYTPALRDALYQEPIFDFADVLTSNASLLQLIQADYTYVNEPLAKLYGIPGVVGAQMRRVALPPDARTRGGVITTGAVMTLTSYPLRTSPVLRGKWVLETVLGLPVPPPPKDVSTLPPDDAPNARGQTFRQRLEMHRSKPECAGCHSRMDPLGFGLENFDPIGRWRTTIGGAPVDASGVLASGEKFAGPTELKALLLSQKQQFARNLSEKMLSYALGRGLETYDKPAVQKIAAALQADKYRSNTLIEQVVESFPFRYRNSEPKAPAQTAMAGDLSARMHRKQSTGPH